MIYYTYYICWSTFNMQYYGVRGCKDLPQNDLWQNYFTSSKYVKRFREEHGEPDIIKIRKEFNDRNRALAWEQTVLIRTNAKTSNNWLNRYDGTYHGAIGPKNHGAKVSAGLLGIPKSTSHKQKLSNANKGKYTWVTNNLKNIKIQQIDCTDFLNNNVEYSRGYTTSNESRIKMSTTRKQLIANGTYITPRNDTRGIKNPMYGKIHSDESKLKMSQHAKLRLSINTNKPIGAKNGMYGKTHTDEVKKASSERMKKMKWYTNGIDNMYLTESAIIPAGYIRGRTVSRNIERTRKD